MQKITFENLPSTNTPLNASNLNTLQDNVEDAFNNTYGTSQTEGYSANYINKLFTYSTTEQRVGTWVNGKPIYKKTFNFSIAGSSSAAGETITSYSALNIDMVIKAEGVVYIAGTNNAFRIIGQSTTPEGAENMRIYGTGSNVNFQRSLFTDDLNCYATIYYTKTTD